MVAGLHASEDAMTRKSIKLIHEGKYAAEVPVELIEDEAGWSPYLSLDDARKLDACAWRCGPATWPPPRSTGACSSSCRCRRDAGSAARPPPLQIGSSPTRL